MKLTRRKLTKYFGVDDYTDPKHATLVTDHGAKVEIYIPIGENNAVEYYVDGYDYDAGADYVNGIFICFDGSFFSMSEVIRDAEDFMREYRNDLENQVRQTLAHENHFRAVQINSLIHAGV